MFRARSMGFEPRGAWCQGVCLCSLRSWTLGGLGVSTTHELGVLLAP